MIQAQIYREWGAAIVKGRVPTGSVGVFGARRVAAVRAIRETRRLRMEQQRRRRTKPKKKTN